MPRLNPEDQTHVIMYSTPGCTDCIGAKAVFKARGIDYVEVDMSQDEVARNRVMALNNGFPSAPTILFFDELVTYDKQGDFQEKLVEPGPADLSAVLFARGFITSF